MSKATKERAVKRAEISKANLNNKLASNTKGETQLLSNLASFKNEKGCDIVKRAVQLDIIETNDYNSIKPDWTWNRPCDTNGSNFRKILKSMKTEGFRKNEPIIVNSEGWITSGNHRYYVAKELGLNLYYIISNSITPDNIVERSNQGKNWGIEEAFNIHLKHRKTHYTKVQEIRVTYGLTLPLALCVCMNKPSLGGKQSNSIKSGQLVLDEAVFAGAHTRAKRIRDITNHSHFVTHGWDKLSYLYGSALHLINHEKYSHRRMLYTLKCGNIGDIQKVGTMDRWLEQLLNLYNYKLSSKSKLIIDTKSIQNIR